MMIFRGGCKDARDPSYAFVIPSYLPVTYCTNLLLSFLPYLSASKTAVLAWPPGHVSQLATLCFQVHVAKQPLAIAA